MAALKKMEVFTKELLVGLLLIAAGVYGFTVGTSWVFTVYFATQERGVVRGVVRGRVGVGLG
jgi:hypothetical protein